MHVPARARALSAAFALALTACLAACDRAPPPAPPIPWLIEVASIDAAAAGAGLSRCREAACEHLTERAILGAGTALRADRGARVTLTLDPATELAFADGAEIELVNAPERAVRVQRGRVVVTRVEDPSPGALPVVVSAAGRDLVVGAGPASIEVRAGTGAADAVTSAIVERGRATLRLDDGGRLLLTGEGARWKAGQAPVPYARFAAAGDDEDAAPAAETPARAAAARGLGAMTARVPGTNDVVSGVRLARHHVRAEVRDGFARTTVEEDFENETTRTLEGRFVFPLPLDASVSRLALYVGDKLMEGEIVDRPLAARVFRAIVDDTVRPRDPAILEQTTGSTVSLKVFPIPPKGKRTVILAYDQALSQQHERARYVYPLSFGPERATPIDDFAVSVSVADSAATLGSAAVAGYEASLRADEQGLTASFSAKAFAPARDFVLRYARATSDAASLSWSPGPKGGPAAEGRGEAPAGYFAVRLRADPPEGAAHRRWSRGARAFVIDTSHSQSADTIDAAVRVTRASLAALDPDDRFAILACDSACASYPEDGLARASETALASAAAWLARRAAGGSSDLAGALLAGAERLHAEGGGQLVYLGDGVATSGELGVPAIRARVVPALRGLDAHFVGVGHSVDEPALAALASAASATYERLATGDPIDERARRIARTLEAPVLRDASLVLPDGAFDVLPSKLPRVRLGQEIRVVGRFRPKPPALDPAAPDPAAPGSAPDTAAASKGATVPAAHRPDDDARPEGGPMREVRLRGQVAGEPYEIVRSLDWDHALASPSPAVHALWARARIAELETAGDPANAKEIVRLSTVHHVLSRKTALLVLENERMFVETGVRAAIDRVLAQPAPAASGASQGGVARASRPSSGADARDFGMIGLLGREGASRSPWGSSDVLGADPLSARGSMWGDAAGQSFGAGGLGLSGVGAGGGGRGEGIGLGSVGTIGHGAGSGSASGFGSGSGRLAGSHRPSAPRVRSGGASVSGRLPPEVIQRIVRQNFGRFRLCYENGLRKNPDLAGRVAVRFVVGRDGASTSAGNGGSDLPDAEVVSCIVAAFRGLRFPEPEGGIVTVVYPISFSPGEGSSSAPSTSSTPSASSTSTPSTPSTSPTPSSSTPQAPRASSWSSASRASSPLTLGQRPTMPSWPSWAPNPQPEASTVAHRAPSEAPPPADDAAVNKLLAQAAAPGAPRSAHQTLVRKLLARGRFDEAYAAASRYLALDPDHDLALELYAQASAATGRGVAALMAVDAQTEAEPHDPARHRRAAAAFELAGDERRACAHFRALASLTADEPAAYHALRCRARLGDRAAALAAALAVPKPGALLTRLLAALEAGSAPPYEPTVAAGAFEVSVACRAETAQCPIPVVVGPTGNVISPWTPAAACTHDALSLPALASGTYHTLLTGEVPDTGAEVTVRVLGQSRTATIVRPGTHLALTSTVTLARASSGMF